MSRSPNRVLAIILGIVYVLVGVGGFFVTSGGLLLGIFEVNLLHNIAHTLIGAGLLIAGLTTARAAKTVNSVLGTVYLVLGIVGLFIVGTPFNILAINGADNVLHFGSSVLLLAVGLGAERDSTTPATA